MHLWDSARDQAYEFYVDPNYTALPFGRYAFEDMARSFTAELWPSGLAANRANLERFVDFMVDQQLLSYPVSVDSLFHRSVVDT